MGFVRLLQEHATKENPRRFFTISREVMNNQIREKIYSIIKQYGGKENLLQDLKKLNVSEEKWRRSIALQIRETYREQEAIEYLCSFGDCSSESPMEIFKRHGKYFDTKTVFMRFHPEESYFRFQSELIMDSPLKVSLQRPSERETVYIVGKVRGDKIEIAHFNDIDMTGIARRLGYPANDDFGRTSSLLFSHTTYQENGSLSVEFENWLFTEMVGSEDDRKQHIEDDTTFRVASRQFLDNEGNKWIVLGASYHARSQSENFGSWLQTSFHTLSHTTFFPEQGERMNIERDGRSEYLSGILGVGAKYSIFENDRVDLVLSGEVLLRPAVGNVDRSNITVKSVLDLNVYRRNHDLPVFQPSLFFEGSALADGSFESKTGLKLTMGAYIKSVLLQLNIFVARFQSDLDERYQKGASWNTGIAITVNTPASRPHKIDFAFN
jgi:hypothetical protein